MSFDSNNWDPFKPVSESNSSGAFETINLDDHEIRQVNFYERDGGWSNADTNWAFSTDTNSHSNSQFYGFSPSSNNNQNSSWGFEPVGSGQDNSSWSPWSPLDGSKPKAPTPLYPSSNLFSGNGNNDSPFKPVDFSPSFKLDRKLK